MLSPSSLTRRDMLGRIGMGFGALGLGDLLAETSSISLNPLAARQPPLPAKAKRVVHLFMNGGPSHLDTFDPKPSLDKYDGKPIPSQLKTERPTGAGLKSPYAFQKYGQSGIEISELFTKTAQHADDLCIIRSMHTEAINHEPAITAMQTGNQIGGRPCIGSWLGYGLGAMNKDLPSFVVLVAEPTNREQMQAISARLWSAGYLPGEHAGVSFRSSGDPILFINDPAGMSKALRRSQLDGLKALNEINFKAVGDPETHTRISQYEMAFRMQASVPELTDLSKETDATWKLYGEEARKPGTFAASTLMARRLAERGVRFVQIYHNNWDHHGNLGGRMPSQCRDIDQPINALITDLKERGMFDDTLIIWGGEFGRTIYSQGGLSRENYGRDHHPRCFSMWMAGGGSKGGAVYGETDEFSYNIVKDPVHIRDFHATALHLMGIQHDRFTYRFQGLDFRLTGVEPAKVIKDLLA